MPRKTTVAATAFVFASLAVTGCASTNGTLRPAPFPGAPAAAAARTTISDRLADTALRYRGVPYRLGGDRPDTGFDCSGFVRFVFAANRIDVPRTVAEQYTAGLDVAIDDLRTGDLVFFTTVAPGASHVGIVVGLRQFVHAPGDRRSVRVDSLDSSYWHTRIVGVRRLL